MALIASSNEFAPSTISSKGTAGVGFMRLAREKQVFIGTPGAFDD